jgi:hypothetical protein
VKNLCHLSGVFRLEPSHFTLRHDQQSTGNHEQPASLTQTDDYKQVWRIHPLCTVEIRGKSRVTSLAARRALHLRTHFSCEIARTNISQT